MMHIGSGIRDKWTFAYTAAEVAAGAKRQQEYRQSRVNWWAEKKAQVLNDIKARGLEVIESIADANYVQTVSAMSGARGNAPRIAIPSDLQEKLQECTQRISHHTNAVHEYAAWVQFLEAKPEEQLQLTQSDWLFFFRTA
jgi:histidinol-phosphate/aromatic aminotransferase/cobyric acid decarboxylase-like protein